MDNPTHYSDKIEHVLIETDEFIFPIRIEQIQYAEIVNKHFIQFYGLDTFYQVDDSKKNIVNLLLQAVFIRIKSSMYINPKQISEYSIKYQSIRLNSGVIIPIQSRFRKPLISYFSKI